MPFPDCTFTCGGVYIAVEDNEVPSAEPPKAGEPTPKRLSPAQWAQLIAAIALAIAQILGQLNPPAQVVEPIKK